MKERNTPTNLLLSSGAPLQIAWSTSLRIRTPITEGMIRIMVNLQDLFNSIHEEYSKKVKEVSRHEKQVRIEVCSRAEQNVKKEVIAQVIRINSFVLDPGCTS